MIVSRVPVQARVAPSHVAIDRDEEVIRSQYISRLLESELLDLYAAILIAVPVALFLKSLWF
jgi:hypothetical protein